MTDKNTIIAVLIAGSSYVTALAFINVNESQNFWFWSSILAWAFLAVFVIRFIQLHKTQKKDVHTYSVKEMLIIQQYVDGITDEISKKVPLQYALQMYGVMLTNILQHSDRKQFEVFYTTMDKFLGLTGNTTPANVSSQSSNGDINDSSINETDDDRDGKC